MQTTNASENICGVVFDIKQFAIFDGPGIRTTVFFKGCPLRCQWCHNPEGLSATVELMVSKNSCTRCGNCEKACPSPGKCATCGKCVLACTLGLRRLCGTAYTAEALAALLLRDAAYLAANGGGYTVSGGEPTFQPEFLLALLKLLQGNHRAVETSGYCQGSVFESMLQQVELVMMDVKLIDPARHKLYTGRDNAMILENLERLKKGNTPFLIRIPLIPGVNDGDENLQKTALLLQNNKQLLGVELLPYHKTAGAKYSMVGRTYAPEFDTARPPNANTEIFEKYNIPCTVL